MKTVAGGFLVLAGLLALLGSLTFGVTGWRRRPHWGSVGIAHGASGRIHLRRPRL